MAAKNKWAKFYFIFQNSEKNGTLKRQETKNRSLQIEYKEPFYFFIFKKIKILN